jgi:hypothetical protein
MSVPQYCYCWGLPSPRNPERTTAENKNFYKYAGRTNLIKEIKMLLKEIVDQYYAVNKLMGQIQFVSDAGETEVITQRLVGKGIKPTLSNIRRYLIKCLTIPLDELPQPEQDIILRSGRPERFE